MQVIEGEEAYVSNLMANIAADDRHDMIAYLAKGSIEVRAFSSWALTCVGQENIETSRHFLRQVERTVREVVDVRLKAAFIGFAALSH